MNSKNKIPLVSLIIPVYNESVRLNSGLSHIVKYLRRQSYVWEILLVDDGSDVPVAADKFPVRLYRTPQNSGKGAAIGLGVSRARGTYVVFCDVDLSVPIEMLPVMLRSLEKSPVVIASRKLPSSTVVVHQSFVREFGGRIFTGLSNSICSTAVSDVTCGFKGFTRSAAKKLFGASRIGRWVFDTEIVYLARKYGLSIKEIPVSWTNKSGSKVKTFDWVQSVFDLLRIRFYDITGLYK